MIDDTTLTEMCKQLIPTLYRISMGILHNVQDAQDAMQQGLLNAWAARKKTAAPNVRAWLTRIVINECRNIQRYRMRVFPLEHMEELPYVPPDRALYDALAALPDDLRLVFLLKYMERYTEKEISQTLCLSIPTVKSRLYRARKSLAKALKEEVDFQ